MVWMNTPQGSGYGVWRYNCGLPMFFLGIGKDGQTVLPITPGSAAETGFRLACK